MILTKQPVSEVCPIRWARTSGRSVIQWDKEDCADAGLVKFDLLGLGMLGALGAIFDSLQESGVRNSRGKFFLYTSSKMKILECMTSCVQPIQSGFSKWNHGHR